MASSLRLFTSASKFSVQSTNAVRFATPRYFSNTAQPNPPIELKTTDAAPKDFVNTNDFFKNKKVFYSL